LPGVKSSLRQLFLSALSHAASIIPAFNTLYSTIIPPCPDLGSVKEAEILAKSGNHIVNSIYEAHGGWEDDKEIITFDDREEAKMRSEYVKKKYVQRQYFNQGKFNEVMVTLSPAFKEVLENQRNKQDAADIASLGVTPPRNSRRRFSLTGGVNTDINPDILSTPRKPKAEINPAIMATPMRPAKQTSKASSDRSSPIQRMNAAVPETPRRGRRHNNSTTSSDAYARSQQSILAAAGATVGLHVEVVDIVKDADKMEDYLMTPRKKALSENVESAPTPSSAWELLGLHRMPSDRSLRNRNEMPSSSMGLHRTPSDRSMRASRGPVGGRASSVCSASSDRSQRTGTRGNLDKSPSVSNLSDNSGHENNSMIQMPSALGLGSTPVRPELGRKSSSFRNAKAEKDDENKSSYIASHLDLRRASLMNATKQLSHRSLMARSSSDRNLVKSPGAGKQGTVMSMRESRTTGDVMTKSPRSVRGARCVDGTSRRGDRTVDGSRRGKRSVDGSHRGNRTVEGSHRRNRTIEGSVTGNRSIEGSRRGDRTLDGSRRGNRTVDGLSHKGDRTSESSTRRERVLDSSRRGERSVDSSARRERILDSNPRKERADSLLDSSARKERTSDASSRRDRTSRPSATGEPAGGTLRKGAARPNSHRISRTKSKDGDTVKNTDEDRTRKTPRFGRKDEHKSPSRRKTVAVVGSREELPGSKSLKPNRCGIIDCLVDEKSDPSTHGRHQPKKDIDGSGNSNSSECRDGNINRSCSRRHEKKSVSSEKVKKRSTDPHRDSSSGRKSTRKGPSRSRRHSTGDADSSLSDASDDDSAKRHLREEKKPDSRATVVPSSKRMMRSFSSTAPEIEPESNAERNKNDRKESSSPGMRRSVSVGSLSGSADLEGAGKHVVRRGKKKDPLMGSAHERKGQSMGDKYKALDNRVLSGSYTGGSLGLLIANSQLSTKRDINEKATAAAEAVATAAAARRTKYPLKGSAGINGQPSIVKVATTGTLGVLAMNGTPSQRVSEVFDLKNHGYKNALVTQWMAKNKEASSKSDGATQPTETKKTTQPSLRNIVMVTPLMPMMTTPNDNPSGVLNGPSATKQRQKSSNSPKSVVGGAKTAESFEEAIVTQWLKA
jgi:hypothetical protein